jgi:hypothetical protein
MRTQSQPNTCAQAYYEQQKLGDREQSRFYDGAEQCEVQDQGRGML